MKNWRFFWVSMALIFMILPISVWAGGQQDEMEGAEKPFAERFQDMTWEEIEKEAEGQTVYFYMWGGADAINNWVTGPYADALSEKGIKLEMVPVNDATMFVNKVLGEKQAGKDENGSVDLMWINGENFKTMRQGDLLFGPYSSKLPNTKNVDMEDQTVQYDFGYPVEGYESPYGAAQMVMIYDQERTPNPPKSVEALIQWIKDNPGEFTYTSLPDFNGSAFLRHLFYYVNGGTEGLMGEFDQQKYDEVAEDFFALLNEIEPYLWREGDTYPENITKLNSLFANGEVAFNFNYGPGDAAAKIKTGQYPDSVRTFVFEGGTIANTNYLAIPYNSGNKAAAMVACNEVLTPELQYSMATDRDSWPLIINVEKIPEEWKEEINGIEHHPSVLSAQVLNEHKLPEMMSEWLVQMEKDWQRIILEN